MGMPPRPTDENPKSLHNWFIIRDTVMEMLSMQNIIIHENIFNYIR